MKLHFLGTRANTDLTAPYHSRHSGVLIDDTILFDLGEEEFLEENPTVIFITHLHPDHAVFTLDDVEMTINTTIYAPEEYEEGEVKVSVVPDEIQLEGHRVVSIPTIHSKLVKSTAYLIESEARVLYTGDMVWIEKEHHDKFGALDLVITDGSFIRKGGFVMSDGESVWGHSGIRRLVDLFSEYTDHIIFTHLGSWFYGNPREARRTLRNLSDTVKIEAAYDGMEITVGD
ncbi:MBL fold metallo-hydrolase [Candidatus Thorarchaeota archaeon]|nr:MAG: MBL fold metallo-hydrolase [Candidatus Thorarchaeota archaeon]